MANVDDMFGDDGMSCDMCGGSCIWKWRGAESWWRSKCQGVTFDLEVER